MWPKAVMMMAVMMTAVMMLVMPVSSRPQKTQMGSDKIESVVSESLSDLRTALLESAMKIEKVIEETIQESITTQEKEAAIVTTGKGKASAPAINSEISKNAVYRNVLPKIFARKSASAMRGGVASVPGSAKDATTTTSTTITTTTLDPLEEYCKEACEAGVGGPECDCPDHPIG